MFDLGFSQLIVIAVVLLIVVGPERLPGVARTAGHLFGRVQRYITDVKADIKREMQLDELKKIQHQARSLEQSLREEMGKVHSTVQEVLSPPELDAGEAAAAPLIAALEGAVQEPRPVPEPDVSTPTLPAKPVDSV